MDALIVEDSIFDALCKKDSTQCYWNAVMAVSYTHLDVYKRQGYMPPERYDSDCYYS